MLPGALTPPIEFLNSVSPVKTWPATVKFSIPFVWPGRVDGVDVEAADLQRREGLGVERLVGVGEDHDVWIAPVTSSRSQTWS